MAAAAAIVPGIKLPYANFSGTIGQMLKPWPQYNSISAPYNPAFSGPVKINGGWGHGNMNTNAYIDITAANFGRVSSQVNLPRVVQFKLRLEY